MNPRSLHSLLLPFFASPFFTVLPLIDPLAHGGSGLADKPVWLLTSRRTYSAAEQFSYNLKMLHRATLAGETTGGATDVGIFHRIDNHFGIGIRESRVRNPYPVPDWAVKGVQPDVRVAAADALAAAEKLAAQRLAHRWIAASHRRGSPLALSSLQGLCGCRGAFHEPPRCQALGDCRRSYPVGRWRSRRYLARPAQTPHA